MLTGHNRPRSWEMQNFGLCWKRLTKIHLLPSPTFLRKRWATCQRLATRNPGILWRGQPFIGLWSFTGQSVIDIGTYSHYMPKRIKAHIMLVCHWHWNLFPLHAEEDQSPHYAGFFVHHAHWRQWGRGYHATRHPVMSWAFRRSWGRFPCVLQVLSPWTNSYLANG